MLAVQVLDAPEAASGHGALLRIFRNLDLGAALRVEAKLGGSEGPEDAGHEGRHDENEDSKETAAADGSYFGELEAMERAGRMQNWIGKLEIELCNREDVDNCFI